MKRLRTLLVVILVTLLSLGCLCLNVKAEEAKETQEVTEVEQLDSQNNDDVVLDENIDSQNGTDVVLEDDNNIVNLNNFSQEDTVNIETEFTEEVLGVELVLTNEPPEIDVTDNNDLIEEIPVGTDSEVVPEFPRPTEKLNITIRLDSSKRPNVKIKLKIEPYIDENNNTFIHNGKAQDYDEDFDYSFENSEYTFEFNDGLYHYLTIDNLYVGQDYSLYIEGIENHTSSINYLCKAGREKQSYAGNNEDNTVACIIHDKTKPESVTNPKIINYIDVQIKEIPDSPVIIPIIEEYRTDKGSLGRRIDQGGKLNVTTFEIYYSKTLDESIHEKRNNLLHVASYSFKRANNTEDNIPVIEYDGTTTEYIYDSEYDVFRRSENVPIDLDNLELVNNEINKIYIYCGLESYTGHSMDFTIYEINLNVDENGVVKEWEIYRLDENGKTKVDEVYFVAYEIEGARLKITNNSASFDEPFEYVLIINSDNNEQEYRIYKNQDFIGPLYPNNPYEFTLNRDESIDVIGVDHGDTYTVKQKKKNNVVSTSAYITNYHDTKQVKLKEEGDWLVSENNLIGVENYFVKAEPYNEPKVPEPCHPKVPEPCHPKVPEPVSYYMNWNNTTDEDLKIIITKSNVPDNYPDDYKDDRYFADSTLEGAVFEISGSNGYYATATTDKNGVVVFDGLDMYQEYRIRETIAPKGHQLNNIQFFYGNYTPEGCIRLVQSDNHENVYVGELYEPPATTKVEVRKFFLPDESKYDGERFEVLNFVFKKSNDGIDSEEVKYRESIWPRSFFKDVKGVEFIMTLDSDPDNPHYIYHAETDGKGLGKFIREEPLKEGEQIDARERVYYGTYTIREVNAPAGMRKMEDQHITITPSRIERNNDTQDITVVRVVNVAARGDLTISKTVEGNNADKNKEFEFTVNLKDKDGNVLTDEYKYEGSKSGSIKSGDTIKLKHGESITIKDLPESTKYEAIEEKVEEYTTKVNGSTTDRISGEIADQEVAKAQFVNTLPDKPEEPIKEEPPKEDPPKETPVEPEKPREYRQPKTGI